jgi:murein DD-endopeptidase MepM/ murein hydrolase activator NlpD
MKRWMWLCLGAAGAVLLVARRRPTLGAPLEGGWPTITPRGYFGADRRGPPAHLHQGIDLVARPGSKVLAVGDGVVVAAKPGLGGIVRKLRLDEEGAWSPYGGAAIAFVVYADLGRALVKAGDRVERGDAIGVVGPRGFVHFAVKTQGEKFIDPKRAGFAYRSTAPEEVSWL